MLLKKLRLPAVWEGVAVYVAFCWRMKFEEHEIDGEHQKENGYEVVPLQALSFEKNRYYYAEHKARDNLLYHLELHKRERAAVYVAAYAVGGY